MQHLLLGVITHFWGVTTRERTVTMSKGTSLTRQRGLRYRAHPVHLTGSVKNSGKMSRSCGWLPQSPVWGMALVTTPSGETCTLKELRPGPRAPQRVGDRLLQRPGQGRPRRQALGEGRCSWVGRAPSPRPLVPGGHSSEGWMGWCPLPPPTPATRGGKHTYPGIPPASILLATVTSVDHTSYCQRFWPRTPPSTVPVCTPTRMSTPVFVFSRTYLPGTHEGGGSGLPAARGSARTQPPSRWRGWLATSSSEPASEWPTAGVTAGLGPSPDSATTGPCDQ